MIEDPNLVNAIENLTRRLSCISLVMWIQLLIMICAGIYFVWWSKEKQFKERD